MYRYLSYENLQFTLTFCTCEFVSRLKWATFLAKFHLVFKFNINTSLYCIIWTNIFSRLKKGFYHPSDTFFALLPNLLLVKCDYVLIHAGNNLLKMHIKNSFCFSILETFLQYTFIRPLGHKSSNLGLPKDTHSLVIFILAPRNLFFPKKKKYWRAFYISVCVCYWVHTYFHRWNVIL